MTLLELQAALARRHGCALLSVPVADSGWSCRARGGSYAGHMSNDDAKRRLSGEPREAAANFLGRMTETERGT
jgi:hypothetical protein